MILKRIAAGFSAAAMAATLIAAGALTCSADDAEITADENGVYGQAGICWMVMDQWDHRRGTEEGPLDESGAIELSGTYHDVNITGNGEYTVDMSGYYPPNDAVTYNIGYLGLYTTMPVETPEDGGTVIITLTEAVIDGTTYTITESPLPEDSELDGKIYKIKNGYGENAKTEPEMDAKAWATTDTMSITFTIEGLPTDKIADNADEVIEQVYGNGSIENDPVEGEEESAAEESAAEESAAEGDTAEPEAEAEEDTDGTAAASPADSTVEEEDSSPRIGLIIGIAAGVIVVAVIVVVIVKKK